MAIPRVLVYSHEDEPLFELDPQQLRGLVLNESINGEHSLTIDTEQELEKEQRVIVEHGGRWKEFVVTGSEERDAEDGGRSYYCAWSLQHDLSVAYIKNAKIGDAQHLHGATDAIAMVASATDRWQVGTVDNTSQSSGWFYYTSAWDALSRVVSQWAGEVDATITMSDPIRRAIDFYAEQGDQDAKRRFDYGRDLTEIQRNVLDDAFVCRIVPRGKGEMVEGSTEPAYGRRITIESVNPTGEEWIQDDDAAMLVRLPDGSGGWEYPARIVIYEDIEEPAELLAAAQRDLQQYTRPKVGYSASVLALTGAGMDVQGVELGDAVQVVDRAFGSDGLRIEARVVGISRNLLDDYDTQLTIGNFQPSTADVIKKLERAQSSMAESVIDTDGKAEASMGIAETAQQVAVAVNQHFWDDAQGAHVTEVTKDEWLDQTGPLYQSGANSLWNSLGMLFRKGLTNLMALVVDDPDDEVLGETGIAIYDGQGNASTNIVASFTNDGVTLGRENESHAKLDYHSLQLVDKEGNSYFQARDLRDRTGKADIQTVFIGDGEKTMYNIIPNALTNSYSVKVNGTEVTSGVTKTYASVTFATAPAQGAEITVSYTTNNLLAKSFTLGVRRSGSSVGALSVAEGNDSEASGAFSHAEGSVSAATGGSSHAEGMGSKARGTASHSEGYLSSATGMASHAEGTGTVASGNESHAEGVNCTASYQCAHAEGLHTTASGYAAHAEGNEANASGGYSHAEGYKTVASGGRSHAQNHGTIARGHNQTAMGLYNVADDTSALIIGNGDSDTSRSNALTVDWSGNVVTAGSVTTTGGASIVKDSRLNRDGTAPSSTQWSRVIGVQDKDGELVGYIQAAQYNDGRILFQILACNEKTDGTQANNSFGLIVAKDGTTSYSITNPTALRTALGKYTRSSVGALDWGTNNDYLIAKSALAYWNGAYSGTTSNLVYCNKGAFGTFATKNSLAAADIPSLDAGKITSGTFARARIENTAWAYLVGSASTVASGNYVRWRMVAGIVFLQVYYRSGAGLAAGASKSIGNIPANYRPSSIVESTGYLGSGNASPCDIWVETNGNVYIITATAASSKFYGTLSYPLG